VSDEPIVDVLFDATGGRAALSAAAGLAPTAIDAATGAVYVLGYEEIDRLAHDSRMAGVGLTWFDLMGIDGDLRRWYGSLMFTNEGETHSRLRRLVSRAFTPRSVDQLRHHTATVVAEVFEDLCRQGGGDLMIAFSPVAMRVMCRLLGVPDEDVMVFVAWADALSPIFGFMEAEQIDAARSALVELLEHLDVLVEQRRGDPGNDLITALLCTEEDGDRLSRDEIITMVANLLVGGHDTTTSQIGCTLLTLMRHPDAGERLRSGAVAVPAAVTETMRYEPSIGVIPRTTTVSLEIGGITRPAGTPVLLSVIIGNRDPAVWEHADSFDIDRFTRPSTPRLLSFGTGTHYCLGANLARMTLDETVHGFVRHDVIADGVLDDVEWRRVLGRSPAALNVRMSSPARTTNTRATTG
jgi:cytochrome P450